MRRLTVFLFALLLAVYVASNVVAIVATKMEEYEDVMNQPQSKGGQP